MGNLKILGVIIFLIGIIPVATASQVIYNKDKIPMFELNNSSLIETIEGYYFDSNASLRRVKISNINNSDVLLDYYMDTTEGELIANHEVDIFKFNISYKIKNNFSSIIPFEFNLGEWPLFFYDGRSNVGITNITAGTGNTSLFIYGNNKSILIPELPPPFEYILSIRNKSTILSIIGRNVSKEGRLDVELIVTEFTPLELSKVNLFKEYSVISLENEKIRIRTDYYKDFNYIVYYMLYFDDPEKTEKPFSENNSLTFNFGFVDYLNWSIISITNDSEKLLLMAPFPNRIIFEPIKVGSLKSGDLFAFAIDPLQVQRLNIRNYENRIEIIDLDRYIFPVSYLHDPEITYLPNKTIIHWNYSQIETPLASIGTIINETQSYKLVSSGNQILIVKPESKKYFSKEIFYINPPVNEKEAPNKIEIERYDTRYPLKPKIPIPLSLDTSSDTYIEYIKVDGEDLIGPWELRPNLSLDEGKYYSFKTPKNTISILFTKNSSNPIDVKLKYTRNVTENIEKLNSYSWKYSLYEFYPVGDIPDYKQIYTIVLPTQYSFSDFPSDAVRQRTSDGRDEIILEYNQSVRYRYINFSVSSEALKKMAEEEEWGYKLKNILSLPNAIGDLRSWIVASIAAFCVYFIYRKIRK